MRLSVLGFVMLALAACGADGPPVAPSMAEPGVTLSGRAEIGISG